ncbi:hypothetical protein SFRURICE_014610 [Spodoptera frugiperda]|nr:hypothetical protein SFRURICE_014610 [Spodoptera frugiperda]
MSVIKNRKSYIDYATNSDFVQPHLTSSQLRCCKRIRRRSQIKLHQTVKSIQRSSDSIVISIRMKSSVLGQRRYNLPYCCNSCKPGSTVNITMKTPENCNPTRHIPINNCLGSRNKINRKK